MTHVEQEAGEMPAHADEEAGELPAHVEQEPVDLLALARAEGWSPVRIAALRNTCAAAAAKESLPAHERELAAAVAAALSGGDRVSAEHMAFLTRWQLFA